MKLRIKKGFKPILFLFLSAAVLGLALFARASGNASMVKPVQPSAVLQDGSWNDSKESYWQHEITTKGGAVAYKEFTTAVLKDPSVMQHSEAHAFGRLLYKVEGIQGIPVCDMQLSMGCYHEFIGQAIAHEGT